MRSQAEGEGVLAHLAHNLRRLRLAAGISQDELARRSGLSRRMINGVEAGNSNISLGNLDHVADALGVEFVDLVKAPHQPLERMDMLMWQSASGASHAKLLGAAPATRQASLWWWELAPHERYDALPDSPGFSEMLYVIEGQLRIVFASEEKLLSKGDFFVFSSAQQYAYVNAGAGVARFTRNVVN